MLHGIVHVGGVGVELDTGMTREQEGIRVARVKQRGDVRLRGPSTRHCTSTGVWTGQLQCVHASDPPAEEGHFTVAASGARSRRIATTASDHQRVSWAWKARPGRVVGVEEPGGVLPRFPDEAGSL